MSKPISTRFSRLISARKCLASLRSELRVLRIKADFEEVADQLTEALIDMYDPQTVDDVRALPDITLQEFGLFRLLGQYEEEEQARRGMENDDDPEWCLDWTNHHLHGNTELIKLIFADPKIQTGEQINDFVGLWAADVNV